MRDFGVQLLLKSVEISIAGKIKLDCYNYLFSKYIYLTVIIKSTRLSWVETKVSLAKVISS